MKDYFTEEMAGTTKDYFAEEVKILPEEEEEELDWMQKLRRKLPKLAPVQEIVGGLAEKGLEKWRESDLPITAEEARRKGMTQTEQYIANIGRQLHALPRFPVDIAEKIITEPPKKAIGTVGELVKYPLDVVGQYMTYISPLSSPEQRREAIERISEDPLGLFFAVGITKGGLKGGQRLKMAVKKARQKKGLPVEEPPVEQVPAVTEEMLAKKAEIPKVEPGLVEKPKLAELEAKKFLKEKHQEAIKGLADDYFRYKREGKTSQADAITQRHPEVNQYVKDWYAKRAAENRARLARELKEKPVTEKPPAEIPKIEPKLAEKPPVEIPKAVKEVTQETKVRGLAQHMEEKAIEGGLTKGFGDLPEYSVLNMADQAKVAADFISKNPEQARRVAMGAEAPPQGLTPEAVLVGIENQALKSGDVATLRNLAVNSELMNEATTMGQRIRTLGERNPESPIGAITEVVKAREKVVHKRIRNIKGVKEKELNDLKTQMRKAKPTKETWASFIKTIKC